MTLVEVAISASLLGLVIATIFGMYLLGLKLWSGNDSRSQLLSSLHLSSRQLGRSVSESTSDGASLNATPDILSLLSPRDDDGNSELSLNGLRRWLSWEVYYREETVLKMSRIPWTGSAAEREVPTPLETATGLTLIGAATGGRTVSRHLYAVEYTIQPDGELLTVDWEFRLPSKGKPNGERLQTQNVFRFRN